MDLKYIELHTKQGTLKGLTKESVGSSKTTYYSFQGIPYAKPPIGKLRFKAPEPYGQWEGVRDCTKEGSESLQKHYLSKNIIGAEDCLYLNVYTTQIDGKETTKKAVMVWIHGGAFLNNSGSTERFGPDFLVEQDIVLVTINYRCGVLGFLSLENDKVPGNMGLKDQTMALRWVQEYIECYGGDSNNVTIFGQSAGGASVQYHMMSSLSRGLFHKAIIQSGFSICQWGLQSKPKEKALLLAKELGCTSEDSDQVLEFLMSISAIDIVNAQGKEILATKKEIIQQLSLVFLPCVEMAGHAPFLADYPQKMMERGDFAHVPVIMGIVDKEGLVFLGIKSLKHADVNTNFSVMVPYDLNIVMGSEVEKELGKNILKFYTNQESLSWDVIHGFVNFITDLHFTVGLQNSRQYFIKYMNTPVYSYKFTYISSRAPSANTFRMVVPDKAEEFIGCGASHSDELVHLFKTNKPQDPFVPPTDEDQIFMTKFLKAWTTFAKTGNPNCKELGVTWKPDSLQNPHYLEIGNMWKTFDSILFPERMEFWKKIYENYSYTH